VGRDTQVCRGIFLGVPPSLKIHWKECKNGIFFNHFGPILDFGVPPNFFNQISVPRAQKD